MGKKGDLLDRYWLDHYVGDPPLGLCTLCGSTGIINTTYVRSPAGVFPGKHSEYCICPNGRAMRKRPARVEKRSRIDEDAPICPECRVSDVMGTGTKHLRGCSRAEEGSKP